MPYDRYVKKAYLMTVHYDNFGYTNWATKIYRNGYGYVWENKYVDNEKSFIHSIIQRLEDLHVL